MQLQNIQWINALRALCMISVYLIHSEFYYGYPGFSYSHALTPFYVNAFFFISGYLIFRKYMGNQKTISFQKEEFRKMIANIVFRLVIPTIVFSTLIYIPKMIFHGNALSFGQYFYDVWGGTSYWFTSALSVAQILLAILLLSKRNQMAFYMSACSLIFLAGTCLHHISPSSFPWYYQTGMTATLLMGLGGVYFRHESQLNKIISKWYVWSTFVALYLSNIAITHPIHSQPLITNYTLMSLWGYITIICSIMLMIVVSRLLPKIKWLEYIGRNSIIFYFFSGVMPALFSNIFSRFVPYNSYAFTLTITCISLLASAGVSVIIQRHFPYLTDFRKLHSS